MSENVKPQTDPVCLLIGATKDFEVGALSYLDDIEGMVIFPLEFRNLSDGDLTTLELAGDVLRPAFEELAGTFSDSYRERGHQMLWALLKAMTEIVALASPKAIASKEGTAANRKRAGDDERRRAVLDAAVRPVMGLTEEQPTKGNAYAELIADDVRAEVRRRGFPGQEKKHFANWPSIRTIRDAVTRILESCPQLKSQDNDASLPANDASLPANDASLPD